MSREKELEIVNNATPGPWEAFGNTVSADAGRCTCSGVEPWPGHEPFCGSEEMAQASEPDALFIATFNPARVLELLDENHELEERHSLERLEIEQLKHRLEAVKKLHFAIDDGNCATCDEQIKHPCPTWKAAQGE